MICNGPQGRSDGAPAVKMQLRKLMEGGGTEVVVAPDDYPGTWVHHRQPCCSAHSGSRLLPKIAICSSTFADTLAMSFLVRRNGNGKIAFTAW
eukprot:5952004-Amphidinium_carterae.1